MLADGYFHQLFPLLEVLETHAALFLIGHVGVLDICLVNGPVLVVCRLGVDRAILNSVHDLEVDSDHSICLSIKLVIVKLSIAVTCTTLAI